MLSFSTSSFSLDVGKEKEKKGGALMFKSVDLIVYCLLCGRPAPRSLVRRSLAKSKTNAHSMAVVECRRKILSTAAA